MYKYFCDCNSILQYWMLSAEICYIIMHTKLTEQLLNQEQKQNLWADFFSSLKKDAKIKFKFLHKRTLHSTVTINCMRKPAAVPQIDIIPCIYMWRTLTLFTHNLSIETSFTLYIHTYVRICNTLYTYAYTLYKNLLVYIRTPTL